MRKLGKYALLLELRDYRAMPWKNGRGVTREIAVFPPYSALVDQSFLWRISLADVTRDCEFSSFPGYDRTLLPAEGNGMALSFDTAPAVEIRERWRPVHFQGEWHTRCRLLDGPVTDFNIMTARAQLSHTCEVLRRQPHALAWQPRSETLMVYCCQGEVTLDGVYGRRIALEAEHTLLLQPHADAAASASLPISAMPRDAVALVIRILPLTQVRHR